MINSQVRKLFFLIWIVCFITAGPLIAQNDSVLTALDVAQLEHVDEIAVAPSGEQAIYSLSVPFDPRQVNKPAESHLYLIDLQSGESIPFVTTMSVNNIAYRPNHNTITFLASRTPEEKTALYEISLAGGEAQKIYSFPSSIYSYTWAPDGNHIAFMAEDTIKYERSPLPYHPQIYEENLKQRRGYITDIEANNGHLHQVQLEGSIYQMHWNPSGEKLALAIAPSPLVDDYYMSQEVVIVDARGQKVLAEVDHQGKLGDIRWSPDGTQLAMLAAADIHDPIAGRLFVVSADGGNPTQLQPKYNGMFEQVEWIDNNTLNFLSSEGVWSTFGTINSDGTNMETTIDKGSVNLSGFDRSDNGTIIFEADSPKHPLELYVLDSDSAEIIRLTNSNPWLEDKELGKQEVVSWTAQDSLELQGILIFPTDYKEGQRYPLITTVHGGPESHYDNGWVTSYSDPGQVAAGQNYFVFYPNYRGSTGRGEEFAKSSQADMAGAEFDDIVAGVDELIKVGIADSQKVGVTGGSYGGYATGWMATRYTDRFAAGVMFVGISNNISKWGTSDIPEELYLVHARERVWENYQGFLERSPIYYAGQADTPLLILAGKEDTRVDPSQSYELYRHIKTRTDTPVRLVLYPEEGHGNRSSTARYDYNLRMMRWFNHYLKGESDERPDVELDLKETTIEN